MFTIAQTFILHIVIITLDLMKSGGHALFEVIAQGNVGEPLQFDRLGWLPCHHILLKAAGRRVGDNNAGIRFARNDIGYLSDNFYCKENLSNHHDENSQLRKRRVRRFCLGVIGAAYAQEN
jgi:hypothetical protein